MITLKNIEKTYHSTEGLLKVLDIDFYQVAKGDQIALVGPSGSGKTTLLNIISGVVAPTAGEVIVDDIRVDLLKEEEKDKFRAEKIGYIFQSFHLINSLTALENVMLPMLFAANKDKKQQQMVAKELLDKVKLSHRLNHKPTNLSRGEQQRVAIARALANEANLILADEPTGNIDYTTGMKVFDLLQNLCVKNNVTLVMVTHSQEFKSRFSKVVDIRDINKAIKIGEEATQWEF
ncbi:MAG: ABC transporter ATP-binding protein [Clostridiaceae bacterium]|nr:ABC transporter ATP-binding protein [Clostridiaceae bacterium]